MYKRWRGFRRQSIAWERENTRQRGKKRVRKREIGQSHRLGSNNPGTRRRVMKAGVAVPLVSRSCVGDMCHCSNSAAQHLLSASTIHCGIPLFKATTVRDIRSSFICWLEYFPVLEIVSTAKWLYLAWSCKSMESPNLIGRSLRAIKSIVVVPKWQHVLLKIHIYDRQYFLARNKLLYSIYRLINKIYNLSSRRARIFIKKKEELRINLQKGINLELFHPWSNCWRLNLQTGSESQSSLLQSRSWRRNL